MNSLSNYVLEKLEIFGSKTVVPLSKIDGETAKKAVVNGLNDGSKTDDMVDYRVQSFKCKDLRASQTELIVFKCLEIAIRKMLKKDGIIGGDLGAIISKDNHIMDGHHRWGASFLCDPNATVIGTQIMLDGENLVSALNIVTKGKYEREGNHAVGNIKDFTGDNITKYLNTFLESGLTAINGKFISPETVKKRLGRVIGANGDYLKGIEIMSKNANLLPKTILKNAPKRFDMPVIKQAEVIDVAKDLKAGKIDITAPYYNK